MVCIFCDKDTHAVSIEHIVPESFGNKYYLVEKGKVCDECNNRLSKNEQKALSNTVFVMERARFAVRTKKGKAVKGKVNELEISGNSNFEEDLLNIKGLSKDNFKDFDPKTGIGHLHIKSFDKSEVATSRMLLKIGLESIYMSQRKIYKKYPFTDLKNYLNTITNDDWPFVVTDFELNKFCSVPKFLDKLRLNHINCKLLFSDMDEETLLFKFKYGAVAMVVNLLNRNLNWIKNYLPNDKVAQLVPEHFKSKIV